MKKRSGLLLSLLLAVSLVLSACGEDNAMNANRTSGNTNEPGAAGSEPMEQEGKFKDLTEEELVLQEEVIERDFKLAIYTGKTHYAVNEKVEVYAELTYIGDQDEIEIGHAMYPVRFNLIEHTRKIEVFGAMNEPYIVTKLKVNEPIRFAFGPIGDYSEQDSAERIQFVNALMNEQPEAGQYTVSAGASFNIHEDQETPGYGFHTSISYIVEAEK